jgi:hypothetical protein
MAANVFSECSMSDFVCLALATYLSSQGDLVVYTESHRGSHKNESMPHVHVFTLNGTLKKARAFDKRLTGLLVAPDGDHLIVGDESGHLIFLNLHTCVF